MFKFKQCTRVLQRKTTNGIHVCLYIVFTGVCVCVCVCVWSEREKTNKELAHVIMEAKYCKIDSQQAGDPREPIV